jgi:hypothetical protein
MRDDWNEDNEQDSKPGQVQPQNGPEPHRMALR